MFLIDVEMPIIVKKIAKIIITFFFIQMTFSAYVTYCNVASSKSAVLVDGNIKSGHGESSKETFERYNEKYSKVTNFLFQSLSANLKSIMKLKLGLIVKGFVILVDISITLYKSRTNTNGFLSQRKHFCTANRCVSYSNAVNLSH